MKANKLRVVIDTNVLLVSISSKSKYHWLFQKILGQEIEISITNEIMMEYEEIISKKYNETVAKNVLRILLTLPSVYKTEIYYNWNLIIDDEDDNKFVDCFLASNANIIVTNDKHFNVLKRSKFPQFTVMNIYEFEDFLKGR